MRRLLVAALALAACNNHFDPASYLAGLRVLGVVADAPELSPGGATKLRAIVVDTDERSIAYRWNACALPPVAGSGDSINLDCLAPDAGAALLPIGQTPEVSFTMPMASTLQLGLPDFTFGVYYPILLTVGAGSDAVTAVYRLRYHLPIDPDPLNQNPKLDRISLVPKGGDAAAPDGGLIEIPPSTDDAPTVHPNDKLTLRATFQAGSAESYTILDLESRSTRTVTEILSVSWFATAGSFSESVTGVDKPDTVLTLDKHLPKPGEAILVYAVARDERGGTDWTRRMLVFQK
jgi:hypothetical protein